MKDETIRFIYELKRNIMKDPVEVAVDYICKTTGIPTKFIEEREVYTFVRDAFFDFINSSDDGMEQLKLFFRCMEDIKLRKVDKSIIFSADNVRAMSVTLQVSQVRDGNMEFTNGFREVEGVDWPLNGYCEKHNLDVEGV